MSRGNDGRGEEKNEDSDREKDDYPNLHRLPMTSSNRPGVFWQMRRIHAYACCIFKTKG
jgi:hypothetical protein